MSYLIYKIRCIHSQACALFKQNKKKCTNKLHRHTLISTRTTVIGAKNVWKCTVEFRKFIFKRVCAWQCWKDHTPSRSYSHAFVKRNFNVNSLFGFVLYSRLLIFIIFGIGNVKIQNIMYVEENRCNKILTDKCNRKNDSKTFGKLSKLYPKNFTFSTLSIS